LPVERLSTAAAKDLNGSPEPSTFLLRDEGSIDVVLQEILILTQKSTKSIRGEDIIQDEGL
jgi:hypothetical protein